MKNRIAVKVGSNVLTRMDGSLDFSRMSSIVDQIAVIRQMGYDVILVSSGAVACGRSELKTMSDRYLGLDPVSQRQMFLAGSSFR